MIDYISRSAPYYIKKDHLESFHFFKINVLLKRKQLPIDGLQHS